MGSGVSGLVMKREYQIGNTKIDKGGDSPVFETDSRKFQHVLDSWFLKPLKI